MAYTALEEMRIINIGRIGRECGPFQPEYYQNGQGWNMKTAALRFLRERLRCHKLMIPGELTQESAIAHYHSLPAEEQEKDIHPMNWMLRLICRLDGVKIYKFW